MKQTKLEHIGARSLSPVFGGLVESVTQARALRSRRRRASEVGRTGMKAVPLRRSVRHGPAWLGWLIFPEAMLGRGASRPTIWRAYIRRRYGRLARR